VFVTSGRKGGGFSTNGDEGGGHSYILLDTHLGERKTRHCLMCLLSWGEREEREAGAILC